MALTAHLLDHLTAAAEGAPRTTVEAVTRALGAVGEPSSFRAAFLARGFNALARLAAESDPDVLREAVGAASDEAVLVEVLQQPHVMAELGEHDPLAPARLRGLDERVRLLAAEGGTVGATEVARLLGI